MWIVNGSVQVFGLFFKALNMLSSFMDINDELVGFHSNVRMLQFLE